MGRYGCILAAKACGFLDLFDFIRVNTAHKGRGRSSVLERPFWTAAQINFELPTWVAQLANEDGFFPSLARLYAFSLPDDHNVRSISECDDVADLVWLIPLQCSQDCAA